MTNNQVAYLMYLGMNFNIFSLSNVSEDSPLFDGYIRAINQSETEEFLEGQKLYACFNALGRCFMYLTKSGKL